MVLLPSSHPPASRGMFTGIVFLLDSALDPKYRAEASKHLHAEGAVCAMRMEDATHVIATTLEFEGKMSVRPDVIVATPTWLEHCFKFDKLMDPQFYSPNPIAVFSGVIATSTDLPRNDVEAIQAGIEALGGQWRHALTKDVTHVFALSDSGEKYEKAMFHKETVGIEVIVPHWFDDCFKLQQRLPTAQYSFPAPAVFTPLASLRTVPAGDHPSESLLARLKVASATDQRNSLYRTVQEASGKREIREGRMKTSSIWGGRKVLLGVDLQLDDSKKSILETSVRRNGGEIVEGEENWNDADVYVTRFRGSRLYHKFLKFDRTVGTVAWVLYVEQVGRLTRPLDQLLHFPVPPEPIRGFEKYEMTLTNYLGDGRDYLKKLIQVMGAQFTATMTSKNTHAIAAHLGGEKVRKAAEWNIPVVNHVWLEECFISWSNLPTGGVKGSKYGLFPPGVNYMTILGERGFGGFTEEMLKVVESPSPSPHSSRLARPPTSPERRRSRSPPDHPPSTAPVPSSSAPTIPAQRHLMALGTLSRTDQLPRPESSNSVGLDGDGPRILSTATTASTKQARKDDLEVDRALLDDEPVGLDDQAAEVNGGNDPDTADDIVEIAAPIRDDHGKGKVKGKENNDKRAGPEEGQLASSSKTRPPISSTKSKTDREQRPLSDAGNEPYTKSAEQKAKKPVSNGKARTDIEMPDAYELDSRSKPLSKPKSSASIVVASNSRQVNGKPSPSKYQRDASESETDDDIIPKISKKVPESSSRNQLKISSVNGFSSPVSKAGKMTTSSSNYRTTSRSPPLATKRKIGPASVVASGRGMASHATGTTSSKKTQPKGQSSKADKEVETISEDEEEEESDSPPEPMVFARSRRTAAAAAENKLRNVVMPDLLNYEKTMKASQGDVRKTSWGVEEKAPAELKKAKKRSREEDESSGIEEIDMRRPSKLSEKKARGRTEAAESPSDIEEELTNRKKTPLSRGNPTVAKNVAKGRTAAVESLSDIEEELTNRKKIPLSRGNPTVSKKVRLDETHRNASSKNGNEPIVRKIQIMTTGCQLRDQDVNILKKLGAKVTEDVRASTHLVATNIVRTKKFMCALAKGNFVVTEEWVRQSAKAKKFLDESKFELHDPAGEEKHDFKLSESVARARTRRLFNGHVFYVTPSVQIDKQILRDIITSNGGEAVEQTPNLRILSGKRERYLISCTQDKKYWLPLIREDPKIAVYTPEFALQSALLQQIDLSSHRVEGSEQEAARFRAGNAMDEDED